MRALAIGDIHGNYTALIQALERANYSPEDDRLITMGDLVDRNHQAYEVVEYLRELPNAIHLRGNHDQWCYEWFLSLGGNIKYIWLSQGGKETLENMFENGVHPGTEKFEKFKEFFGNQVNYYVNEDNHLFVHAGIAPLTARAGDTEVEKSSYYWDRKLWQTALSHAENRTVPNAQSCFTQYDKIFIGHTSLYGPSMGRDDKAALPKKALNVWNIDTGAGSSGKVCVMDVETEEFWQSDFSG